MGVNKIFLIILISMCSFLSTVSSTPSSIIWIPSTDIQASDKTHFGIDSYFTPKPMQPGESTGAFTTPDIGLTWGRGNFEFGLDYIAQQDSPVLFNAKYKFLGKKPTDLNMVIGVYNVGTSSAMNQEVKYLLASAATKDGTRFSLGYGIGRTEALGENNNQLIMASIDKQLNDKWWVAVDYQGSTSALGALNFGFSYNFTPATSILVGYDIYNNKDFKNTITVQLDINF